MATFIALIDYTEQGIKNIKGAPDRAAAFAEQARAMDVTIKDLYWTSGIHDGFLVFEAPDGETASALLLSLAQAGNVSTHTLRAYDRSEMQTILGKMK
jgi:uncharacterized protein with GYD domain